MDGLGRNNSGCLINFGEDDDGDTIYKLVTWNMVLKGGMSGIQVWSERTEFRNLATAFNNRKKTNIGLVSLLNAMYIEMFGDRVQCMYLISCFYRTQLKQKQLEIKSYSSAKELNDEKEDSLFEGNSYNHLISDIDLTFKNAIVSTYNSFCVLGEPLVSAQEINALVDRFKIQMKVHHYMMKRLLGIDRKEGLSKNRHLVSTGYYDRLIFYNFLALSRIRNSQNCINYAIVSAAALYSKGCGDNIQKRSTYSGTSATVKTFLKHVCPYGDNMLQSAASVLYKNKYSVAVLDNNQKGHPSKFQRFGSSNKFVKVTARYFREFSPYITSMNTTNKHTTVTYVNQQIPSPDPMLPFEKLYHNEKLKFNLLTNIILNHNIDNDNSTATIDFSGKRVEAYANIINICDEVQFGLRRYLTGYNKSNRTFKYWPHLPQQYQTIQRDRIVKLVNGTKQSVLVKCASFQTTVTLEWNPACKKATKLLVPPVSLRDEIKTDGFGMAAIELLCLVGILHEEKVSDTYTKWDLDPNWHERRMFLCIDGLSLDRHRHFQKKLSNVKLSFTKAFRQSIIFQKALSRVIEINGPLHMAFHMLQTIYTVFGTMLKWAQTIVDWKRLTSSKVCDSFDLCRQLMFLMLDELDRLAWDMFLCEKRNEIEIMKVNAINDDAFVLVLVDEYLSYLQSSAQSTTDERRKYMFYYILMGRKFRQFWYAMRRGDRVMQEYITIQWVGVFYLLKKHNYFEICLSAMEKEYGGISYHDLQSVRINSSVRYRNGKDSKGNDYPLHVLDEVMENINAWTKRLLLGPDEVSWKIHSPNLMCAHRSNNFESDAFTKQRVEWNNKEEATVKEYVSLSTKTTEPRKTVERRRLYEWAVLMFDGEQRRYVTEKDGFSIIKSITTALKNPSTVNAVGAQTDHLEECIEDIFYNIETIETARIDKSSIEPESVPNNDLLDTEAIEDDTSTVDKCNRGKINSLSLINIFEHGEKELKKLM